MLLKIYFIKTILFVEHQKLYKWSINDNISNYFRRRTLLLNAHFRFAVVLVRLMMVY